jgi:hypothetical protein
MLEATYHVTDDIIRQAASPLQTQFDLDSLLEESCIHCTLSSKPMSHLRLTPGGFEHED